MRQVTTSACDPIEVQPMLPSHQRDPEHIFDACPPLHLDQTEGSNMYLIDGLIVLAMSFFFVLPMTDAKTAQMKLSVVSCLGVLLIISVIAPCRMH